jgi:hypothetical protein
MEGAQTGRDEVIETDLVDVASMPLGQVLSADDAVLQYALQRLARQRGESAQVVVAGFGNALP